MMRKEGHMITKIEVELQWLEHCWLVYHGYFELVLESLETFAITGDIIIELC